MNDDPLEGRLRDVLRDLGTPRDLDLDADDVLRDVHRGASRRRTRRTVSASAVIALAAVGGLTLLPTTLDDFRSSVTGSPTVSDTGRQSPDEATSRTQMTTGSGTTQPSNSLGTPATAPVSQGIAVSLTASGNDYQWVLAATDDGSCATSQCAVVYSTSDAGVSPWSGPSRLGVPVSADGPQAGTVQEVRFARADPAKQADGWAFGGALLSSHDSGSTWTSVPLPVQGVVTHLEAWGNDVYASVDGTSPSLLRSPAGVDDWQPMSVPGGVGQVRALAVARDVAAFIDTGTGGPGRVMVSTDGGQAWVSSSPCRGLAPEQLSAADSSLWLVCATGAAATAWVTTDGVHWSDVAAPAAPFTLVGRTQDTAVTVSAGTVELLQQGVAPSILSRPPVGDVVFAGFTNPATGYLVEADGRMWRTSDGGAFWRQYAVHR